MSHGFHPRMISSRWRDVWLAKSERVMNYCCPNRFLMVYSTLQPQNYLLVYYCKLFCYLLIFYPERTGYKAQEELTAHLCTMEEFSRRIAKSLSSRNSESPWTKSLRTIILKPVVLWSRATLFIYIFSSSQLTDGLILQMSQVAKIIGNIKLLEKLKRLRKCSNVCILLVPKTDLRLIPLIIEFFLSFHCRAPSNFLNCSWPRKWSEIPGYLSF